MGTPIWPLCGPQIDSFQKPLFHCPLRQPATTQLKTTTTASESQRYFCNESFSMLSAKMTAMADHVDHSSGDEADVEDEQIDENGKIFMTMCNCVTC